MCIFTLTGCLYICFWKYTFNKSNLAREKFIDALIAWEEYQGRSHPLDKRLSH